MAWMILEDTNGVAGTTSAVPAALTGTGPNGAYTRQSGDRAYIYVVNKAATITPATPSGWTSIGSVSVGTGTNGVNTGPVRITVFRFTLTSSTLTIPTITVASGSTTVAGLLLMRPGSAGDTISEAFTSGSDTTSGTGWSVAGAANPGFTTDDYCIVVNGMTANASGLETDATIALSVPGCTVDATDKGELTDSQGSSGNHVQLVAAYFVIASGTATGVPTFSSTLILANTGGAFFLRLRATPANPVPVPDAGADVTGWLRGRQFTRTGTATNSPTSYAWNLTSAPAGVTTGAVSATAALAYTPTASGTYTFSFNASNVGGSGVADTMTLTVLPGQRLYFTSDPPDAPTGVTLGSWNGFSGNDRKLGLAPSGSPAAITSLADTVTTNPYKVLVAQFLSPQFERSATLNAGSTACTITLSAIESAAAADMTLWCTIYTMAHDFSSGTTVYDAALGTELPTTQTATTYNIVLTSTAGVAVGEWLIVEIGYRATNTVTTSYTTTIRSGGTDTTDLAAGDTITNQNLRSGWIHFNDVAYETAWSPIAIISNAGSDKAGVVNTYTRLDGTYTGGLADSVQWVIVSGPADVGKVISTQDVATYFPPAAGSYVIRYDAMNEITAAGVGDTMTLTVPTPAGTVQVPSRVSVGWVDSVDGTNGDLTINGFTLEVGDLVVVKAHTNNSGQGATGASVSANGDAQLVWLTHGSSVDATRDSVYMWVGVIIAAGTYDIAFTPGVSGPRSVYVEQWRGGAYNRNDAQNTPKFNNTSSAPNSSLTAVGSDNSVISWALVDWNESDPVSAVYRSNAVAARATLRATFESTYYAYQITDAAGAQAIGMTAPATMDWRMIACEIRGQYVVVDTTMFFLGGQ